MTRGADPLKDDIVLEDSKAVIASEPLLQIGEIRHVRVHDLSALDATDVIVIGAEVIVVIRSAEKLAMTDLALDPLKKYGIREAAVCTYQAISGAGKTFKTMPEILDNVIPYIGGEEEKSEQEPLKIWGKVENGEIKPATSPAITAQCLRVPVSDGHTAAVFVKFENKPSKEEILNAWKEFSGVPQALALPSAPKQFIHYMEEDNRPQPALDRMLENGMAIEAGRLREDNMGIFDYKFIGLSHNTLRGAAGGAVLLAELLAAKGYFD